MNPWPAGPIGASPREHMFSLQRRRRDRRIAAIDVIADPERLGHLDLAVPDA